MQLNDKVQHVYLVGAKSLGAYGGYETFVYKLTEYHQNKENIKYHVACKANGDGCMDESKFEGVTKINDHEFELHNAHCFKIDVPQIGPAQAIYYDVAALKTCCEHIKKNHIPHPIVYIMACRILSTTFDKYCYVNVRHLPRFFDYSTELSYSKTERVTCIEDIQHPAIRNAMKMLDMHEIRLTYEADLPARSGLGTSSSFAVGMLNAFYALKGRYADKKKLANEAIYLERNLCQEAGGWQDQIAASFGGFNRINFNADGYEVLPVIIAPDRKKQLNKNLMMFFTGFTRFSSDVQKANATGKTDKTAQLKEMLALVDEAEKVLVNKERDLDDFGRMLDHTWKLKRQTGSAVSTNSIDELYAKTKKI